MTYDTPTQHKIERLIYHRNEILSHLSAIEDILRIDFPKEFDRALQFYIPQIVTALHENKKWLSRGEYSLQNTIDNISERCKSSDNCSNSIQRYI